LPAAEQAARQAEVTLNNVRRQYQRTLQLQRQGFIGQAQLDDAQRNLEVAQSQLRAARLQVDTNTVRGSDYLLARAALAQALAAQRMAAARLDYTRITAPLDGILIARNVERGDVVQPGKALMVLSPAGQIQVVVQIDEKNLPALRLGQKALASADAYPEQRFATELVYLNPAVDPQRGSVEAKFRALDPPAYLRQDMTVSVDIEVAHRRNAVVVPVESVHDGSGNGAWVLTVSGRHARRRAVRTGVRGSGKVEIVDGLVPGEQVIASTAAGIVDGQRVRPVAATGRSSSGPAPSASVRSIP
jgi:HlyD family secretion protein